MDRTTCMRCPTFLAHSLNHGHSLKALAKCQFDTPEDGEFRVDLWPAFKDAEVSASGQKESRQKFWEETPRYAMEYLGDIEMAIRNGSNPRDLETDKTTMEAAAKRAYPPSDEVPAKQEKSSSGSTVTGSFPTKPSSSSITATSMTPTNQQASFGVGLPPSTAGPSSAATSGAIAPTGLGSTGAATSPATLPSGHIVPIFGQAPIQPSSNATPALNPSASAFASSSTSAPGTSIAASTQATVPATAPAAATASTTAPPRNPDLDPLARPAGPKFMTMTNQQTDPVSALQHVDNFAGRLADIDHNHQQARANVPPANRTQLTNLQRQNTTPAMINKFGLRKSFANPTNVMIETNHLTLRFPSRLYVYGIEMIRGYNAAGNPILVRRYWDKREVLRMLIAQGRLGTRLTNPANSSSWVSDGSMIWSTVASFDNTNAAVVPPSLIATPAQPIQYDNECGVQLNIARVNITFRQRIDLTQDVRQLFFDTTAPGFDESLPSILARGLNAFLTKSVANPANPYTCIGQHKSFPNNIGHPQCPTQVLDPAGQDMLRAIGGFSLSVRPGIQSLYVNVNKATSPFFVSITVQEFIDRSRAAGRSRSDVVHQLKGLKVRITHTTNNDLATFPRTNSRLRFITALGVLANQQGRLRPVYPHTPNVGAWYAAQSPYNMDASFPNPALQLTGAEWAINVGEDPNTDMNNVEWYPATQLQIEGEQPFSGRLSGLQTSVMIRQACQPPFRHRQSIISPAMFGGMFHFQFANPGQGGLATANIAAGTNFIRVPGRLLGPPQVRYSRIRDIANAATDQQNAATPNNVTPNNASWNLRSAGFANSSQVPVLRVLNLSGTPLPPEPQPGTQGANNSWQHRLRTQLRGHGLLAAFNVPIQVNAATVPIPYQAILAETAFGNALNQLTSQSHAIGPVLVVIPDFDYDIYACIKRVADCMRGTQTICVKRGNMTNARFSPQLISNLALKYNIKASGDNHLIGGATLNVLRQHGKANTIVMGADVTNPNDSSHPFSPSIAAVVGSVDDNFVRFPGSMRLQMSKKEDIVDLADMVRERLVAWANNHGRQLPQNILFYRDGVSESQYGIVRRRELPQIQTGMNLAYRELNPHAPAGIPPGLPPAAPTVTGNLGKEERARKLKEGEENAADVVELDPNNRPLNLTFIVVGKRHNTRFYSVSGNQHHPTVQNVTAGLVVDQVITNPYNMDFYLQSHLPIQGTGRSAHYFVLRNNMNLSTDQLQSITHTFCYAYARATRGVSYCAPAYYADRLCDRGRSYLRYLYTANPAYAIAAKPPALTWEQYAAAVKTLIQGNAHHWPRSPGRANPWHRNLDNTMFYL